MLAPSLTQLELRWAPEHYPDRTVYRRWRFDRSLRRILIAAPRLRITLTVPIATAYLDADNLPSRQADPPTNAAVVEQQHDEYQHWRSLLDADADDPTVRHRVTVRRLDAEFVLRCVPDESVDELAARQQRYAVIRHQRDASEYVAFDAMLCVIALQAIVMSLVALIAIVL